MGILRCRPAIPCPPPAPLTLGPPYFCLVFWLGKQPVKLTIRGVPHPQGGGQLLPALTRLPNSPLKSLFGIPKKYGFLSGTRCSYCLLNRE